MSASTLALTRITKDMGATVKAGAMTVAEPDRLVTQDMLKDVAPGSGLNGPFLADLVVAMAAHENMGVNMFRVLQNLTANPMLQSVFADFEKDALEAVGVYSILMSALDIPMYYISDAARMTEGLDSHMIMSFLEGGSADALTIDLKGVEAVLLAATLCVTNTMLLGKIAAETEGDTKAALDAAVAQLEGPANEHLAWAEQTRQKMVLALVQHPTTHKLMEFAEKVVAKVTGTAP
jgi:hypothetical protein